jgi:agmatine deiminase
MESDGQGTILTTASCNANPNRNPHMSREDTNRSFSQFLGASRVLWLEHGYLAGDDTDGHIDMLARFAPHDTMVYQSCDNPDDEHFEELSAMAQELENMTTPSGHPYRLIPLPWPSAKYDEDQQRLPVSYANYLILNGVVLVPIYDDPRDAQALTLISKAYPGRKVVGIDCSALILQHGSLHCVTMQLPKGVLG